MAIFYVFPLPVISIIAVFGGIWQYWIEKYVLLRRHKLPEQISATMAQVFSNMIPFFCFIYGISLYAFSDILSGGKAPIGLAAFLITLIYMLIPVRYCINKLGSEANRYDNMTYEKHSITFITDYDRSNPMTEKDANIKFLEKMKEAGELDKEQYQQQLNYYNQGGRFNGVMNYGQQNNSLQGRVYNTYQQPVMYVRAAPQIRMMGGGGVYQYGAPNPGMPAMYQRRMFHPMQMRMGGNVMMQQRVVYANQGMVRVAQQPQMVIRQPQAVVQPIAGQQQYANTAQNVQPNQQVAYARVAYQQPAQQPAQQPVQQYQANPNYAQPQFVSFIMQKLQQ